MSWTHSSKGAILGVLLALSLVAVGTAAAISFSGTPPEPANVNDTASMEVTIEDPFEDQSDQWTLRGESELENATWTVEVYEQGQLVGRTEGQGTFEQTLARGGENTPDRIEVSVTGGVPALNTFDYENRSAEEYTAVRLVNANTDEELQSWSAHRFTAASNEARSAIDDANAVVDDLEDPSDEVQNKLQQAIDAYNDGSFDLAVELAGEAQSLAEDQRQQQENSGLPIALIGGVAVVALLAVVGGVYYWRSQQSGDYKLQ